MASEEFFGGSGAASGGGSVIDLAPLRGEPPRVSVRVGRRRVGVLLERTARELGLRSGMAFDEALVERVREGEAADAAMRDLMRMLSRRGLSERAAQERLLGKGHSPRAAHAACARGQASGLLDDERAAREALERMTRRGAMGRAALEATLREAGFVEETVRRAIESGGAGEPGESEADRAEALARARLVGNENVTPKDVRRVLGLLGRRGFSEEVACEALERVLGRSLDAWDEAG